jgi:hypothetical protein
MISHDPLRSAQEIRESLASEKRRLTFFLGAGTSMAVGFPGIDSLTQKVLDILQEPSKGQFTQILEELPTGSNVENILDRIRLYCELSGNTEEKKYGCLGGTDARNLDYAVCQAICEVICGDPPKGLQPHLIFAQWLRWLYTSRDWPVEIFTTNFDLLIERAMEELGIPFFDGFIGSVSPFFVPESVDAEMGRTNESACPPRAWTRLWKIHGSINWHIKKYNKNRERITRLSGTEFKKADQLIQTQ